ncbi:MFS general substrate transporter [Lindgomyces ingoldianus]|uniref:MFS general substrate transporter n=1 Tax=Lindgomyces ingoldianus TaxID=673940 RepID=A0ACB6R205_9PLEO|nr:MFS general substrate transporter [Lindgomyces ingoldianus]KAF2472476.1 MFS general substrate transporter [Lindgomyces ingoldianus]
MSANHAPETYVPRSPSTSSDDSDVALSIGSSKKTSPSQSFEFTEQDLLIRENNVPDSSNGRNLTYSGRDRHERELFITTNVQAGTALPQVDVTEQTEATKEEPISWRSLPRKDQLLILTLSRLSEPLTQTSLGAYLFYQLQSFDPSAPDSTISFQAGVVQAAFPAAQFLTAILWGRFADSEYGGRKRVIWIGLLGTMLSVIGFGFSHSFPVAVLFRCMGGILNGNIGVMRTMISEIIKEKKYQSRAFIILPMTFNIGVIIGPILGGILADPVGSYPGIFGPGSVIGGKNGVEWMRKWPYALPNLMSAIFLLISVCGVLLFLEETSEMAKHRPDYGLRVGRWIRRHILRQNIADGYTVLAVDEPGDVELQQTPVSAYPETLGIVSDKPLIRRKLPFRRIWTPNLIMTLSSHGLLAMHVGTFNSLWFIYLSAPRYDPVHPHPKNFKPHGLIHFTGGLALPPPRIGLALAILGFVGITLQLFLYPKLSHRLGTAKSYRLFLLLFPITYTLVPFLSTVPTWSKPPAGVSGILIWLCITVVLFLQVLARTFALPCATILINNCCPHPSVLGTVHGLGQSVSSLTRTFGPILGGYIFGRGLDIGVVGLAWWTLACVAVVGSVAARFVRDGDGHEILLEGEVKGADGVVRRVD